MTRRRFDGLRVHLDGAHNNSTTTLAFDDPLTYDNGTAVPTISGGDYLALTIVDSTGRMTEVVHLTAYTSGGTSGTVVRGREGTTGVSHADGDGVLLSMLTRDLELYPAPRTPGSQDDEFDGLSGVSWANGPYAPTTWDINSTVRGKGYLRANNAGSNHFASVLQAIPGAYPFTVTARFQSNRRANTHLGMGLILGPASPATSSKILWAGGEYSSAFLFQRLLYNTWDASSFVGAATGNGLTAWGGAYWVKLVATSATSLALYTSTDGELWSAVETGLNPGFTPGVMGVGLSENGTADLEGTVDFFRVT